MTPIFLLNLIFYSIPLSIYDVIYDITTTPKSTLLLLFLQLSSYHIANDEMFYELALLMISLFIL